MRTLIEILAGLAILAAAGFVLLAIVAAASIGGRRSERSGLAERAKQPEPQT